MRWLALLLVIAACARDAATPSDGISRNTFVAVYVDLSRAQARSTPEQFQELRHEILRRHGVTEADLKAFIHSHGHRLDYMSEIWDSVRQQLASRDSEAQ